MLLRNIITREHCLIEICVHPVTIRVRDDLARTSDYRALKVRSALKWIHVAPLLHLPAKSSFVLVFIHLTP